MITTTYPDISAFSDHVATHDFFIVGELHGVTQNARIMQSLLDETLRQASGCALLAFEWLLDDASLAAVRRFIDNVNDQIETPTFFQDSDGRFTSAHADLLRYVRSLNAQHPGCVQISVFDTNSSAPERTMAENLARIRSETAYPILVETGVVHAQKKMLEKGSTMAGILSKDLDVFSVFVRYVEGKVYVEGEIYDVRDAASQQEGPRDAFDAVLEVKRADAATKPIPLTIFH